MRVPAGIVAASTGLRTELVKQALQIDRLAAGVLLAFGRRRVAARLGIAERAAPRRLEGDLDAVAVEVPQIDRFGDQMIGRRDADIALQRADGELREVGARRHVDGDVVETGGALHDRAGRSGLEHDQGLAANAQPKLIALFGQKLEAHHVAPNGQRLGAVGDGDVNRAEFGGERQGGRGADFGLGFDGEDHLRLRKLADPDIGLRRPQ